MAAGTHSAGLQDVVSALEAPSLPNPPATIGGILGWAARLIIPLRFVFSRYGMIANALSQSIDENRTRVHFHQRFL